MAVACSPNFVRLPNHPRLCSLQGCELLVVFLIVTMVCFPSTTLYLIHCGGYFVTAQPQPQPNSTSTLVGLDKVISWTTPPNITVQLLKHFNITKNLFFYGGQPHSFSQWKMTSFKKIKVDLNF
jgi:hypothetical protein